MSKALATITICCLSFAPTLGHAQTTQQAESFLRHLYSRYAPDDTSPNNPDFTGKDAATTFTPSLVQLIRHDRKTTPRGDAPRLDLDPICSCQDSGGMKLMQVSVTQQGPNRAQGLVTLHFPEPADLHLRFALLWTPQGWRVDDVSSNDIPSLRKFLSEPAP